MAPQLVRPNPPNPPNFGSDFASEYLSEAVLLSVCVCVAY